MNLNIAFRQQTPLQQIKSDKELTLMAYIRIPNHGQARIYPYCD